MARKFYSRSTEKLTRVPYGFTDLPTACVRANQTGFFALAQRVNPESYDSDNRDIDPSGCFFGGRRIDLAIGARNAEDFAAKGTDTLPSGGPESDSASSE